MANRKIQGHYSQNYQPLGRLLIQYDNTKDISGYKRTLDLNEAVAATRYTRDGYSFSTEYLASAPIQPRHTKIPSKLKDMPPTNPIPTITTGLRIPTSISMTRPEAYTSLLS